MARSVGAAAAQGLESGFNLGLRARAVEREEEDRTRRQGREDTLFAQQQADRARRLADEEDDRALKAIEAQYAALRDEGSGYLQQYGGMDKVPPEVARRYSERAGAVTAARQKLLDKRWQPQVQSAADRVSRWQTGQEDPLQATPVDLYRTLAYSTRRDPRDLVGKDGQPSRVAMATTELMTGIETGNEGMTLRAANVLLEPELKVGVGEMSPYGGRIVGKEIVKLLPHPNDPEQALPVIKVYVNTKPSNAAEAANAERVQAEPGAPPGATGYYLAPITQGRSGDPSDPVQGISVKRAMEYAAQLQTLSSSLSSHPELLRRLEEGAAEDARTPNSFQQMFFSVGGKLPTKQISWHNVPEGGTALGLDQQGRVVQSVSGPPKRPAATGLAADISAVQQYAADNGITEDEAARRLQGRGLLKAQKGAGGTGGGGGGGGLQMPKKGVTGEAVLEGLDEDDATIVRGLADGSVRPSEISTKGNRRERMLALAKRFDPAADFGPNGRLKEVPAAAASAMAENDTNLRRAERALRLVGGAPAKPGETGTVDKNATGLKGYLPNQVLNRVDPSGVDARAAIADLGSLVIHSRSGAAVTAAEFPRLAPFIPTEKDDPDAVVKKLKRFVEVYNEEQAALQAIYSKDNGYKSLKNVGGGGGAQAPAPAAPAAAPAPGLQAALPPVDRRGWRLMVDGKGNRAYVSPDGMNFEEVR